MNDMNSYYLEPTEDPRYHDTWQLLKKYRDITWSLEVAVRQARSQFTLEYGSSIEDFLESIYCAGANLGGSELEDHTRCIERSKKMLDLLSNAVELMRTRHKNGQYYYWLLYYYAISVFAHTIASVKKQLKY